jgi:hypothetical protein
VERFDLADPHSRDSAPIRFAVMTGAFHPDDQVLEEHELTIGDLPALRFELAGDRGRRVVYVIGVDGSLPYGGSERRFVLASTTGGDETFDRDTGALAEMLDRFTVTTPFHEPSDVSQAANRLMDETAHCRNSSGFEIRYPSTWFTNTKTDGGSACAYFAPTELASDGHGAWLTLEVIEGAFGTTDPVVSFESVNVGGRPAQRTETGGAGSAEGHVYRYVVQLTEQIAGRNFIGTVRFDQSDDYTLAKAVADRILQTIEFTRP